MIIEVVYVTYSEQTVLTLKLASPCTVLTAIQVSKILERHPEIDLQENKVGIFGKIVSLDHLLTDRDRIEIYRPLKIDPKTARRLRAKNKKV